MKVACDTNVLLDLLVANAPHHQASKQALSDLATKGALRIGDTVYAELGAAFDGHGARLRAFVHDLRIEHVRDTQAVLVDAGGRWRAYRRAGGSRRRIVPDFLVAAHAAATSDALLTRDKGFYRRWFEDVRVIDPSAA